MVATALAGALASACSPDGASTAAAGRWSPPAGLTADPATVPMCAALDSADVPEPVEVAAGLQVPWDMAFLPDGRVLVVERGGAIRQVVDGELAAEPWATVPVRSVAEGGLLGIAADPDFPRTGHVYVVATTVDGSLARRVGRVLGRLLGDPDVTAWTNRIVRLTDVDGRGTEPTEVVRGLAVGPIHAGGGLRFGPDGRLYVGIGEGGVPSRAADPASAGGKIHAIDVTGGGVPEVFASGLRNPQAFAFDPASGALLVADHGPTGLPVEGFRTGHDELNVVRAGKTYGWPLVAGRWRGDVSIGTAPMAEWTPSIAPGGITVVDDSTTAWHGDLILTSLVQGQLVRVSTGRAPGSARVTSDSLSAECVTNLYVGRYGRLRAVHQAPDGDIWFTTSNRDQRGTPGDRDDRLMRFSPPAAQTGATR